MKIKLLSIFLIIFSISFSGCDKPTEEKKDLYDKDAKGSKQPEKNLATTKIEFEESEHDFGTIEQGKPVSYVFKFKNTGDAPLVISEAKPSCGCTVPTFTQEPIKPGEEGKIDVKYNGSGSPGHEFSKNITVSANTEPAQTTLIIKGKIRE